MLLEKILRFLNFKLFFFVAISLSLIGLLIVFSEILLIEGFLDFTGIEFEFLENLPQFYFFIPLIFWNIPLVVVIVARIVYKRSYNK